jgi:hypothetical protein
MTRTATITLVKDGETDEVTLAELVYQRDASREGVSGLDENVVIPSTSQRLTVRSACAEINGNTSFMIEYDGVHHLTVMCRWADVDPYVGLRVSAVPGWLHIYCQRK